jgi:hypothetical protein
MKHKNYTIPSSVVMQKIDDEALLMDADTHLFYELNATAAVLWEVIEQYDNFDDVVTEMLAYFEVSKEELEDDLKNFMLSLQEQGMILLNEK